MNSVFTSTSGLVWYCSRGQLVQFFWAPSPAVTHAAKQSLPGWKRPF